MIHTPHLDFLFINTWPGGKYTPRDQYDPDPGSGQEAFLQDEELNQANQLCEEIYLLKLPEVDSEQWKQMISHQYYPAFFHVIGAFDDLGLPEPKQT